MTADLHTTNILLGIMAAVSVVEVLAAIAITVGALYVCRQLVKVAKRFEDQHVAPAASRVTAILDDVKTVTFSVRQEAGRLEGLLDWILDTLDKRRRRRRSSDTDRPSTVM
jgi:hypothetical protein